jgi:hypothetical protein
VRLVMTRTTASTLADLCVSPNPVVHGIPVYTPFGQDVLFSSSSLVMPAYVTPGADAVWSVFVITPGGGGAGETAAHLFCRVVVGLRTWCVPVQLHTCLEVVSHANTPRLGDSHIGLWLPVSLDLMGGRALGIVDVGVFWHTTVAPIVYCPCGAVHPWSR